METDPMRTRMMSWWRSRPDDQKYRTIDALAVDAKFVAENSDVDICSHRDLRVVGNDEEGGLALQFTGIDGEVRAGLPTNHAFGQISSIAGAPAKWLRKLPATLAADNLNFGLQALSGRDNTKVLTYHGDDAPITRALVGPDYGQIYDHQLCEVAKEITQKNGANWVVPCESKVLDLPDASTLYRSDRDMWLCFIDDSRPIEIYNATKQAMEQLYRGIIISHSEVGLRSLRGMTFLFRSFCANHMIYAVDATVTEFSMRHSKFAPERFEREFQPLLQKYAGASTEKVQAQVTRSMNDIVATDRDGVKAWLQSRQFTAKESEKIIDTAEVEEGRAKSVWELVQGGTAIARDKKHMDDRASMEKRISSLMEVYSEAA